MLTLHTQHLAKQHEHWLALCTERIGAAKGELADAFAGVLSELRTGMLTEYTLSLSVLKEQMHVEYRGRLGRLADELTAKHASSLAAAYGERNRIKEPERPLGTPAPRPRR
ncbi:MAG: hypothetical protein DDT20_01891 [Firmicutes bacterium]|nr:hypothetical protein [Bacillota bacterium]